MERQETLSKIDVIKARREGFLKTCDTEIKRREAVLQSMIGLDKGIHNYKNSLDVLKTKTALRLQSMGKPIDLGPAQIVNDKYPELYAEAWAVEITPQIYAAISILQQSRHLSGEEWDNAIKSIQEVIPGFHFALIADLGKKPPVMLVGDKGHKELSQKAEEIFDGDIFQIISGVVVLDGNKQLFQLEAFESLAPDWTVHTHNGANLRIETWGVENGKVYEQAGEVVYDILGPNCKRVVRKME